MRGGAHPLGSPEWSGGVILDLEVQAVRFWKAGKAQEASFYKALAEILLNEWSKTGYIVDGKLQFPYATGMNVETGHGWKTPVTFAVDKNGKVIIAGGSIVGSFGILPALKKNPFLDPLRVDSLAAYDSVPMDGDAIDKAKAYITQIVSEPGRTYTEADNTYVPDKKRSIVEPRTYNANIWDAINARNYQQALYWANQVLAEPEWIRLAQRDQQVKKQEVGGLVEFIWGTPPEAQPEAEAKIWRYPLLNEVAVAVWAKAVANYKMGNMAEAKHWIREMIEKYSLHQIYDPGGPGYWNTILSWEDNPGNNQLDAEMGPAYREVLREMGLTSAVPKEVPVTSIGRPSSAPSRPLAVPTPSAQPGTVTTGRQETPAGALRMKSYNSGDIHSRFYDFHPHLVNPNLTVNFQWDGPAGRIYVRLLKAGINPNIHAGIVPINVKPGMNTVQISLPGEVSQLSFHFGLAWGALLADGEVSNVTISNSSNPAPAPSLAPVEPAPAPKPMVPAPKHQLSFLN
jgi:hypothetical protein